jgi:hypothetical protein
VVVIAGGESRAAVLEGFTITGGRGTRRAIHGLGVDSGGGILVVNSSATISSNVITGNRVVVPDADRVTGYGGGIFLGAGPFHDPSPLVVGNVISDNHAGSNGGGIGVEGYVVPEILNNDIKQNRTTYGDGGGIWMLLDKGGAVVRGNRIERNSAGDHGGGVHAAFVNTNVPPERIVISDNIFWLNRAEAVEPITGKSGGGIWLFRFDGEVTGNTLVSNYGGGTSDYWGGGIAVEHSGSPRIERNIIAFSLKGGGIRCGGGTTPLIRNNLGWANNGGNGVGSCIDWVGGNGNIEVDPLFCNPDAGDLSVAENSPALTHPAGVIGAISQAGCQTREPSSLWISEKRSLPRRR